MENKDGSWRVLSRRVSQEYVAVVLWARNKHLERMWRLIKGPHDTTSPPWEIELDPSFVTDAHQSLKEHWMPELLAEYKARKGKPATKPQQRQIYSLAPIATTSNLKRWVGTCCGRSALCCYYYVGNRSLLVTSSFGMCRVWSGSRSRRPVGQQLS